MRADLCHSDGEGEHNNPQRKGDIGAESEENTNGSCMCVYACDLAFHHDVTQQMRLLVHPDASAAGPINAGPLRSAVPVLPSLHFPFPSRHSFPETLIRTVFCFLRTAKEERKIHPQLSRREKSASAKKAVPGPDLTNTPSQQQKQTALMHLSHK